MRHNHRLLPALTLLLLSVVASARSGENPPTAFVRIPATALDVPSGPADWADVWEVDRDEGWALLAVDGEDLSRLDAAGIARQWDWEKTREAEASTSADLSCYAKVSQIEQELFDLASARPDLVDLFDYGDSWEKVSSGGSGGHELWGVRLTDHSTDDRQKPRIFYMSAIHAREMATAEITRALIAKLAGSFESDPDIAGLLRENEVWIVPVANPDGRVQAEKGLLWRKNTDNLNGCHTTGQYGTDLNRNSTYMWNHGGSSANPCDETYRGPAAASEPEVASLEALFPSLWPYRGTLDDSVPADEETTIGMMVTLHSYAQWILRPLGYVKKPSSNEMSLKAIGDRYGDFTGYRSGISSIALYVASVATDDVVYGVYGVPAFTFEVGTAFFEDCSKVPALVAKGVDALIYGIRLGRQPYKLVWGPDVAVAVDSAVRSRAGSHVALRVSASQKSSTKPILSVRAAVDLPSWRGGETIALSPVDGRFDGLTEDAVLDLDTTGLAPGSHTIWFEGIGSDGQVGPPAAARVDVIDGDDLFRNPGGGRQR